MKETSKYILLQEHATNMYMRKVGGVCDMREQGEEFKFYRTLRLFVKLESMMTTLLKIQDSRFKIRNIVTSSLFTLHTAVLFTIS